MDRNKTDCMWQIHWFLELDSHFSVFFLSSLMISYVYNVKLPSERGGLFPGVLLNSEIIQRHFSKTHQQVRPKSISGSCKYYIWSISTVYRMCIVYAVQLYIIVYIYMIKYNHNNYINPRNINYITYILFKLICSNWDSKTFAPQCIPGGSVRADNWLGVMRSAIVSCGSVRV